jgi:uncharacterized protein with HEPN domain
MSRGVKLYLAEIVENMDRAMQALSGVEYDGFVDDWQKTYAVVRCFEIIGEASKNVPHEVRESFPEIPWRTMAAMRDKMIHAYFGIDHETVWKAVKEDLPRVRPAVWQLLAELRRTQGP